MLEDNVINKIITAAIVGMIGWILLSVTDMSTRLAVLTSEVNSLRSFVESGTDDRYTATEARGDLALINQRIERLETWTNNLSNRLAKVEDSIRNRVIGRDQDGDARRTD